jgi:hypothetical protein
MIHIVTALHAEARPLIDRFDLRARQGTLPFPVFEGEATILVVCGVGKVQAAAAAGWVGGAATSPGTTTWLNVGVCGHASLPPGTSRVAHRIEDATSGRRWYPPQITKPPCTSASLRTVDRQETGYSSQDIYDREAAGFYPVALRFVSAELAQCIKIVSDNTGNDPSRVTPALAESLVSDAMPIVSRFVEQLHELASELDRIHAEPPETEAFLSKWRFTVTQRHQLLWLLRQWRALQPDRPLDPGEFPARTTAKALLQALRARTTRCHPGGESV